MCYKALGKQISGISQDFSGVVPPTALPPRPVVETCLLPLKGNPYSPVISVNLVNHCPKDSIESTYSLIWSSSVKMENRVDRTPTKPSLYQDAALSVSLASSMAFCCCKGFFCLLVSGMLNVKQIHVGWLYGLWLCFQERLIISVMPPRHWCHIAYGVNGLM